MPVLKIKKSWAEIQSLFRQSRPWKEAVYITAHPIMLLHTDERIYLSIIISFDLICCCLLTVCRRPHCFEREKKHRVANCSANTGNVWESQPPSLGTLWPHFAGLFHIKATGGIRGECVWSQELELHPRWCHSGRAALGKFDYQPYITWHLYCLQYIPQLGCTSGGWPVQKLPPLFPSLSLSLKKRKKPHLLSDFSMATADTAYQRCTWAAA